MSWAALASNQCVSCNNLQNAVDTSVFVLKNAIPVSTKQITKAEAESYVYIDTITGKVSNQLVVKSNLTAATPLPYSYTLYFDFNDDSALVGFDTSTEACGATNSITVYSSSSSIGIGTALYADAYGTEPILASCINQIYFKIGGSYITFEPSAPLQGDGYIINSIGTCSIVYITVSSGLYPVTGASSLVLGNIYNNTAANVYFIVVFNSGGVSSGMVYYDDLFILDIPGGISIQGGVITGFGTTLTSQFNIPLYSGIITMPANSSSNFSLEKNDGYESGSTLRIYYSTDFTNFSPIPVL